MLEICNSEEVLKDKTVSKRDNCCYEGAVLVLCLTQRGILRISREVIFTSRAADAGIIPTF